SSILRGPGKLISFWDEGGQLGVECQSSELIKSCPSQTCGPKSFKACQDLSQAINNTCSLLMNRSELEDYIGAVEAEVESNARLYSIYKANFLVQAKDKRESACFIKEFDGNDQYTDVIEALKFKFEETYKEAYSPTLFDCDSTVNISEELNFRELRCASTSETDVLAKLNDASLDAAYKRFYGNCLSQKAYQAPEFWFRFNITEINRLLNDGVAIKDEGLAQRLQELKAKMDVKKVAKAEGE
ncbi:MAG: hypothetical protein NTX25_00500, partial [Proteobacteria bacterium]|nr:hypothetical protein [Pseudomonadota bacterium]